MAEVTYHVGLPFVAADDGTAAGESTECFSRCERLEREEISVELRRS